MPGNGPPVELVNVDADRVCLAFLDQADRAANLVEILFRVDAHERTGRAVFLAGVSLALRPRRVYACTLAEVALDGKQVFRLRNRRRKLGRAEPEERRQSCPDAGPSVSVRFGI